MGNDTAIIYGDSHGASYERELPIVEGEPSEGKRVTHWDPKIEVTHFGHAVHLGIFPVDNEKSTDDGPVYDRDRAQFITLSRDACNRLIASVREARTSVYGKDE